MRTKTVGELGEAAGGCEVAFARARNESALARGSYKGSLGEKGSFVLVRESPVPLREAEMIAAEMLGDENSRFAAGTLSPAGAIPVTPAAAEDNPGWYFFGIVST